MKAAQKKARRAAARHVNLMSFPSGGDSEWALVKSYSDVKPLSPTTCST
jgi:hypothetical protein